MGLWDLLNWLVDAAHPDSAPGFLCAAVNIGCGLLFAGLSLPVVYRKIPMNGWYGFRLEKAFQSDGLWYDINAYGGRLLLRGSIALILLGTISLFIPFELLGETMTPVLLLPLTVGPLLCLVFAVTFRTMKYATQLPPPNETERKPPYGDPLGSGSNSDRNLLIIFLSIVAWFVFVTGLIFTMVALSNRL